MTAVNLKKDDQASAHLEELEKTMRSKQRKAAVATAVLLLCVISASYVTTRRVSARLRELESLKQKVADAQQEKQALEEAKRRLDEDIERRRKEVRELEGDKVELSNYLTKIRAILEQGKNAGKADSVTLNETGTIPVALKNGIRPRVAVARTGADESPVYSVELWLDMPRANEDVVESIAYDLDPRFYERKHFVNRASPSKHVQFSVRRCESKVLTSIVLQGGQGSIALDFEWCKTAEWQDAVGQRRQ